MMIQDGMLVYKQKFPSPSSHIDLYVVTYVSQGLKVKGYLAEPKGKGRYPGFLYLRGGIKSVGMVRIARVIQFASEGFVVMAPFYRGNRGGEGNEDFAGEDRFDAVNGFRVLESHSKVDKDHIHVFGFSRGGVMALWTGILLPQVRSIVSWGGVSDMVLTYEERIDLRRMMKRVIGGTPWKYPERYDWRTPIDEIHQLEAPVLIIHGKRDENVSVEHAKRLENALNREGKQVEAWLYEEYDHYFPPPVNRKIVRDLTRWMKEKS